MRTVSPSRAGALFSQTFGPDTLTIPMESPRWGGRDAQPAVKRSRTSRDTEKPSDR